uniref:Secreted protein n=1 Tax=Rhipicephalus appendiculatus TaxID=34631 RepID=A0A131YED0_RHIAP
MVFSRDIGVFLHLVFLLFTLLQASTCVLAGITQSRTPSNVPQAVPRRVTRPNAVNKTAILMQAFQSAYGHPGSSLRPPRSPPHPAPVRRPAPSPIGKPQAQKRPGPAWNCFGCGPSPWRRENAAH